jgi:UDP-2-acetamido-2-deoxy-ribo-hexuluronate aminotransferase
VQLVDLKTPYERYGADIERRMRAVMTHGAFIMGPEVAEVEEKLAAFVGVKHAVTTSSGTQSLELALRALGVGAGDEVVTVAFSWISSAEVIALVGAKPVFVDIEPRSFNLDARLLERAITPRTKAVLAVSLFGQMADFASINAVADKHGLPVIEDGAQSFGATQHARRSSGVTLLGSTSFFPAKPLGCYGDGGALFTSDDALATKLRALRSHGGVERHHHTLVGTNARFDTLQAAVLLGKLPHFEQELAERRRIGARYSDLLRDVCVVPDVMAENTHVYAQYTLRVKNRDQLGSRLKEAGIPTAVYYPKCLHQQPVFAGIAGWSELPESERAAREVISLPMHPYLSEADQDRVVAAVKRAIG